MNDNLNNNPLDPMNNPVSDTPVANDNNISSVGNVLPVQETPILPTADFAQAAPLPPVQVIEPRPSRFSLKTVMIVVASFMAISAIVAGAWYAYVQYAGEDARIAEISGISKQECEAKGCNATGYKWVWRSSDQTCRASNIKCDTNGNGDYVPPDNRQKYISYNSNDCGGGTKPYYDCSGCRDQYPNGFCVLKSANETCYQAQAAICGEGQTTGATCSTAQTPTFPVMKTCTCAGEIVKFDRNGYCGGAAGDGDTINEGNNMGLCGVFFNSGKVCADGTNGNNQTPIDYSDCFSWTSNGLTINPNAGDNCSACEGYKHTCVNGRDMSGGCNTNNPQIGKNLSFDKECGYTQQIDLYCGNLFEHRSYHAPDCSPKPSNTSTNASLSCTSLTKNVATPTIGSVVTLTCAGAVSPAGATNLTYKFRYNVNSGAWVNLTNATATTAQFTPNQCGTYSAQCQACGTINGSQVCDPVWSAATAR